MYLSPLEYDSAKSTNMCQRCSPPCIPRRDDLELPCRILFVHRHRLKTLARKWQLQLEERKNQTMPYHCSHSYLYSICCSVQFEYGFL